MVEKAKKILKKHHFWRTVGFDELSELYVSQMLRSLAGSLIGLFVPIYLYKIGYSITAICLMFMVWFLVRPFWAVVSAKIIGRFGPKHAMALSVILQILYLTLILSIQTIQWPLWLVAIVGSFCYGLFMMAFEVDFSKIKHTKHGGAELGYLVMFEQVGAVIGPIVGGLVATFIDPRYTVALAIIVLCGSLIPLFRSAEPVKRHQLIVIKGFPWKRHKRDMFVSAAFTLENVVTITIWPLFLGIFVLQNNTYAVLGALVAVSTATAFVSVYIIGKLIDKNRGRAMLNFGAIANSIVHLFRPFVALPVQALTVNVVDEPLTAMYRMPFLKGRYDASDSVPGYRITYFMIVEFFVSWSNVLFWALLAVLSVSFGGKPALQISFVIGAILSLLITQQRFAALRK